MALFSKKPETKDETSYSVATAGNSSSAVLVPSILVQPRISEKAGHLSSLNKYVFVVRKNANKVEVKKAVEAGYKVKVIQVNMIVNGGKARNFNNRSGRTQGFKKAIVTLKAGDKIEGVTETI